jgi:DNA-binding response OmpR family regulator
MKGRILIIDDEPSIQDALGSYLKQSGFTVVTASSGQEALAACQREEFDVITVDVVLPDTDGLELLSKLRAMKPMTPIIVATGNDPTPTLLNTAKKNGASGFASKMAPLNELVAQVETLMQMK